eukprot:TRINITY_DN7781_c0_g1_i1.p1 TRINITY_DN7781_c0_g1~~TRINITY_DN7781_c0_g1_i1.p1  ORF type:complete len:559 (-),score=27.88 TRINITY_DN7781_c0_g1_i1:53-1729(-)
MEPTIEYDLSSPFNPNGACDYCHKRKMRCDKTKPQCNECVKRNIKCNYGLRLKRGPKMKRQTKSVKVETPKEEPDQVLENIQNNNSSYHIDAMLFEVAFNKKIAELWQSLCPPEGTNPAVTDFTRKIRPEFDLATESFIRSPTAVQSLVEDFQATYKIMFNLNNFASNIDFATKIWQAIIEINFADLLTVLNTFDTPLLVTILEYLVAFTLCLKLNNYEDISSYISSIIHQVINAIVYMRDFTNDCLRSSPMTVQFIMCVTLMAGYFKMCKDGHALQANVRLAYDLYDQYRNTPHVNKELEARLCCRMIMTSKTAELRNYWLNRIDQLGLEKSDNLHYHINLHLTTQALYTHKEMTVAEKDVQRAEYYVVKYLESVPEDKRESMAGFYDCYLSVLHSEVAMRAGDGELARRKMGHVFETFPKLTPAYRNLFFYNTDFIVYRLMSNTNAALTQEYLALLKPNTSMYKQPRYIPSTIQSLAYDTEELIESDENNSNYNSYDNSSLHSPLDAPSSSEELPVVSYIDYPVNHYFQVAAQYYSSYYNDNNGPQTFVNNNRMYN